MLPDVGTLRAAKEAASHLDDRVFTEIGGHADPQAAKELVDLIDAVCRAIVDSYFLGKADHAKDQVAIPFSARKHKQWADDGDEDEAAFDEKLKGISPPSLPQDNNPSGTRAHSGCGGAKPSKDRRKP